MTNGNGTPPEAAQAPQLNVLAQYTKDLSFENPNAPASLQAQGQPPQINIQINVSANNLSEQEFEVTLSVEGKAESAGKEAGVLHSGSAVLSRTGRRCRPARRGRRRRRAWDR